MAERNAAALAANRDVRPLSERPRPKATPAVLPMRNPSPNLVAVGRDLGEYRGRRREEASGQQARPVRSRLPSYECRRHQRQHLERTCESPPYGFEDARGIGAVCPEPAAGFLLEPASIYDAAASILLERFRRGGRELGRHDRSSLSQSASLMRARRS